MSNPNDNNNNTNNVHPVPDPLAWTKDPANKHVLADYAIIIPSKDGEEGSTYRVHSLVLANKSVVINSDIQGQHGGGNTAYESFNVNGLSKKAADAIPTMFDFIYGNGHVEITPENVVALIVLALYFGIDELKKQATNFLKKQAPDLGIKDLETLYHVAKSSEDYALIDIVADQCVSKIKDIVEAESALLHVFDVEFWENVIQEATSDIRDSVPLVLKLCSIHERSLDNETFARWYPTHCWNVPKDAPIQIIIDLLKFANKFAVGSPLQIGCVLVILEHRIRIGDMLDMPAPHQDGSILPLLKERAELVRNAEAFGKVLPESILVSGAGSAEVNGLYSRVAGGHNGKPSYVKEGTWKKHEGAKFYIGVNLDYSHVPTPLWTIWVEYDVRYEFEAILYRSFSFVGRADAVGSGIENLPPAKFWWLDEDIENEGVDPAPTLEYDPLPSNGGN